MIDVANKSPTVSAEMTSSSLSPSRSSSENQPNTTSTLSSHEQYVTTDGTFLEPSTPANAVKPESNDQTNDSEASTAPHQSPTEATLSQLNLFGDASEDHTSSEITSANSLADPLVGGEGTDSFVYDHPVSVSVFGTDYNSLEIFDSGVDLGSLNPIAMDSINLDLVLDNYLSLSAQDVQNMSEHAHLVIDGSPNDVINLEGPWAQGESIDGYTRFSTEGAMVSVDNSIVDAGNVHILV